MESDVGFWRRQFSGHATSWQKSFDVVLGIVAPIACVLADPGIFSNTGRPMLIDDLPLLRSFAYAFIAAQILALATWLALPRCRPLPAAILASMFGTGGLFSIALGVKMLPLTFIGMFFVIGFLGLTPFFTGFVFLRNGRRAFEIARSRLRAPALAFLCLLGILLAVMPPLGAHEYSRYTLTRLIENPDSDSALQQARWFGSWRRNDLVMEYEQEKDGARKQRMAKAYVRLTGEEIEDALARYRD